MVKRCPNCGEVKPLSEFTPDKWKASGYSSWCKPCIAERSRAYYKRTAGEKAKARYRADRKAWMARSNARRQERFAADPEKERQKRREQSRKRTPRERRVEYMKRHGGIDEWARMWDAQDGCCYLCGKTLEGVPQQMIAVDHDHDCHPSNRGRTESCQYCRRGLTHAWCNQLIGLAGEDMGMLRAIIANFERVNAETKARIASRSYAQDTLWSA